MSDIKENIANNLKFFRKERKVTQKKLGEVLGVENNTISSWESGTNNIDASSLMEICDYLNVSLDDMFGRENKNTSAMEMSEAEKIFIFHYHKLSHDNQMKVMGMVEIKLDEESATKEEHEEKTKLKERGGNVIYIKFGKGDFS